jgi:hypothetical protein
VRYLGTKQKLGKQKAEIAGTKAEGRRQRAEMLCGHGAKKVLLPGVTWCYRVLPGPVPTGQWRALPAVCDRRQPRKIFGLIWFDSV